MIKYSKSLLLIWSLAELEAKNLKQENIHPAHFFLGILKSVEVDLVRILRKQSEEVQLEIRKDILDLKSCVGEFISDITYTRRFLRNILPRDLQLSVERDSKLRRSRASRDVFHKCEQLYPSISREVLPIHLLSILLESNDPHIVVSLDKASIDIGSFKKYTDNFIRKCFGK